MQYTENKKMYAMLNNVAELAKFAYDEGDEQDIQTWDAYEACVSMLSEFKTYGYCLEAMQESLEERELY